MQKALQVIPEVHKEWERIIGRPFAPLIEEYRLEDADYAIVTIGGMTGTGKDAIDAARDQGEKVGLIKIKTFRPFPLDALKGAFSKVKAIGVLDRSVSFGWNTGPVYQEMLSALYHADLRMPALSFIGGLAGADITIDDFSQVIETTAKALKGEMPESTVWLD